MPDRAASAGVYDHLLGGLDSYGPDRQAAAALSAVFPGAGAFTQVNRRYIGRAVRYAAARGITRFVDLGCGYVLAPAVPGPQRAGLESVCETARDASPAAVTCCVDWDETVTGCIAAQQVPGTIPVTADLAGPGTVLKHPAVAEAAGGPGCWVLGMVLCNYDAGAARQVVAGYARAVAAGSIIVVTVAGATDVKLFARLAGMWEEHAGVRLHAHDPEALAGILGGLEVIRPGIGPAQGMTPGWGDAARWPPGPVYVLAATARVPE